MLLKIVHGYKSAMKVLSFAFVRNDAVVGYVKQFGMFFMDCISFCKGIFVCTIYYSNKKWQLF
jgi:general stress protein CsbA